MNIEPLIPSETTPPEITLKAIVLSVIITILLAASNAYLALKMGVTISASIPAAIISMGVLSLFRKNNVLENNIVQTAASAGDGIAGVAAFLLPAFIIIHYWTYFNYWESVVITLLGGGLGVLFSIPLRRVLLNNPTLPFPEGTAVGNVLKAKAGGAKKQLKKLISGLGAGGVIVVFQTGLQLIASDMQVWFKMGSQAYGFALGFSPALTAAGYIVGMRVAMPILVGVVIGWLLGVPILTAIYGIPSGASTYASVMTIWDQHLRYIGVGTMVLGGLWTIVTLVKPILLGLRTLIDSLRSQQAISDLKRTEKDIPFKPALVALILLAILIFIAIIFELVGHAYFSMHLIIFMAVFAIIYIFLAGFITSAISAYFTGLVGATNNPISGLILGNIIIFGLLTLLLFGRTFESSEHLIVGVAFVLIVATFIIAISAINMENLQDLKAGQIVGATPWKQQVMLFFGVIASSLVVAPILNLLFHAYGIAGVFPHPGMDPSQMLAAPQASMMATLAKGVLGSHLPIKMLMTGVALAVIIIGVDEYLKPRGYRLPVLAVGLGIYLPMEVLVPVIVGAIVRGLAQRKMKQRSQNYRKATEEKQTGTILACGLVAGAALMGVLLAIPFVIYGSADALKLAGIGPGYQPVAWVLGIAVTLLLCFWLYKMDAKSVE